MSDTSTEAPIQTGLEFSIGRARVAVPVESVYQIIQYETTPLPLARRWVGGLSVYQGRIIISVALIGDRAPDTARRKETEGIVVSADESEIGWALEVLSVVGMVQATVRPKREQPGSDKLPPWISAARTVDGRSIGWLDVPTLLKDLVGSSDFVGV